MKLVRLLTCNRSMLVMKEFLMGFILFLAFIAMLSLSVYVGERYACECDVV